MFQLGRRNLNNLEEAQQLFGKRFALSLGKYFEAGKHIRLGINR
jgi:hypothetical protein